MAGDNDGSCVDARFGRGKPDLLFSEAFLTRATTLVQRVCGAGLARSRGRGKSAGPQGRTNDSGKKEAGQ